MKKRGVYEKYIKRFQDFVCSFLALVVLSPILLVVAVYSVQSDRRSRLIRSPLPTKWISDLEM